MARVDAGPETSHCVARVYSSVRSAHLERFAHMTPADVYFHGTRYDFDASLSSAGTTLIPIAGWRLPFRLARRYYRVVEVNEPLMTARWRALLMTVAVLRLRSLVTGRRTDVVAYCIENADPSARVLRRLPLPAWLRSVITRCVVRVLVGGVDRLAFGTTGSLDRYASVVGSRPVLARSRVFEAVPSPCDCPAPESSASRRDRVIFVGSFTERKGIRQLLDSWGLVHTANPAARLTLIGQGPLLDEVREWAARRGEVSVEVDPPRDRIHRALRDSAVLVLPSQRLGAWREQVGLPILEGLSHGCEVVTTSETGLASWLTAHGHAVVVDPVDTTALASAISGALRSERTVADVLHDLPPVDQRIAADLWLLDAEHVGHRGPGRA